MNKPLTSIIAAAALVVLAAPMAEATFDRSLPTKHSHARVIKAKQKTLRAVRPSTTIVSPALICPEQAPGDSWGHCVLASPSIAASSNASTSTVGSVPTDTYNDTAGT